MAYVAHVDDHCASNVINMYKYVSIPKYRHQDYLGSAQGL